VLTVSVKVCALLLDEMDEKLLARLKGVLGDDHVRSSITTVKVYVSFAGCRCYKCTDLTTSKTTIRWHEAECEAFEN
jgi:hypothetical protein